MVAKGKTSRNVMGGTDELLAVSATKWFVGQHFSACSRRTYLSCNDAVAATLANVSAKWRESDQDESRSRSH